MTEPRHEDQNEPAEEETSPFELAEEGALSPDAAAKALAEHQMEAMEEIQESAPFGLAEETAARAAAAAGAEAEEEEEEDGQGAADADTPLIMDLGEAKKLIETILFVAHEPLRPRDISFLFRGVENVNAKVVRKLLAELVEEYAERTLQIVEVAEGYRMCTRAEFSPWVRRFLKAARKARLSQAALESLAIIAYKQPITRMEIEHIRRVDCSGVLHTLLERNLVRILGRRDVVGRPIVYGTTSLFLEHFGFKNLADMPKPEEFEGAEDLDLAGGSMGGEIIPLEEGEVPAEGAFGGIILAAPETHSGENGHANGHGNGGPGLAETPAEEAGPEGEEEKG